MATTTKRGLNKPDRTSLVNVITAINNNMDNLDDAVPDSRKVNGKALSSDVTIDDADLPIIAGKIASTQAMIAPPFVEATPNAAGSYVTNAGVLYFLPNGHTANTTWANTSKTEVKAGSELTKLKSALRTVGDVDLIAGGNRSNTTNQDVSFTWNADKTACTVDGTNSSSSAFAGQYFIGTDTTIPDGIEPGESYLVSVTSTSNQVRLVFYFYVNGAYSSNQSFYEAGVLSVPATATGMRVLVGLRPGQTADNDVISGIALQKNNFDHIESSKVSSIALTSEQVSALQSLFDVPVGNFFVANSNRIMELCPNFPYALTSGIDYSICVSAYGNAGAYLFDIERATLAEHYRGYSNVALTTITWSDISYSVLQNDIASLQTQTNAVDKKTDFVRRNIFHDAGTFSDVDSHGITYAWTNETTCHISGEADAASFNNIINSQSALPGGIKVGDVLHLHVNAPSGCGVRVYLYPNTLPNRNVFYKSDALIRIPEGCIGMLVRLEVENGTEIAEGGADISTYLLSMPSDNDIGKFFYQEESVKILVFGSSFSYSTLGYLPEILEEIAPGIRVTLGICYDSGQTINGHISNFDNNTKYTEYSEYDPAVGKWTNLAASVTGKNALDRHKWDYVVIQQACRSVTDTMSGSTVTRTAEQNYQDLATFAEKIAGYIEYPTSFLFNMVQALGANSTFPASYTQATAKEKSNAMMLNIAAYAQRAMNDCIISDVLPCGTAIQNMRTDSSTDSIGTTGYLTCDNNGHLQNGIGVLVAGYAAAYKVMQLIGKKQKMFGIQLTPTDALLTEWDLYTKTSHKTCVGVTDGNKLLGQKCALMANKKPFEITDFGS